MRQKFMPHRLHFFVLKEPGRFAAHIILMKFIDYTKTNNPLSSKKAVAGVSVLAALSLALGLSLSPVFANEPAPVVGPTNVSQTNSQFAQEQTQLKSELRTIAAADKKFHEEAAVEKQRLEAVAAVERQAIINAEIAAETQRLADESAAIAQQQANEAAAAEAQRHAAIPPAPQPQAPPAAPVVIEPAAPVPAASRTIHIAGSGGQEAIDACIGPVHFTPLSGYAFFITEHDFCGGWARFSGIQVGEIVDVPGYGTYTAQSRGTVPQGGDTGDVVNALGYMPAVVIQTCIPGTSNMLVIGLG